MYVGHITYLQDIASLTVKFLEPEMMAGIIWTHISVVFSGNTGCCGEAQWFGKQFIQHWADNWAHFWLCWGKGHPLGKNKQSHQILFLMLLLNADDSPAGSSLRGNSGELIDSH